MVLPALKVSRKGLAAATVVLIGLPVLAMESAEAAVTTSASCTDGGGVVFRSQVRWGDTYSSSSGTKVHIEYVGWTTTTGTMATDSVVTTYSGSTAGQTLTNTRSFDYKQGTAYDSVDPADPSSGGAKVVIALGKDNDGKPKCETTHVQPGTLAAASGGWKQTWSDEFNGSSVDSGKWSVRDDWTLGQDFAVTKRANATVANGELRMKTDRLPTPVVTSDGRKRLMSTVYMDTNRKFSQQYGRWEIRLNLGMTEGASSGMWPAFWLRDDEGGTGEIDIMEALGSPHRQSKAEPYGSFGATLHRDTSHRLPERWRSGPRMLPDGSDFSTGWHTLAYEWSPTEMKFYADGHLLDTVKASSLPWYQEAFSNKYSIRLCVQWGDKWAMPQLARPEDMVTPAVTKVDYIRVYQRA